MRKLFSYGLFSKITIKPNAKLLRAAKMHTSAASAVSHKAGSQANAPTTPDAKSAPAYNPDTEYDNGNPDYHPGHSTEHPDERPGSREPVDHPDAMPVGNDPDYSDSMYRGP